MDSRATGCGQKDRKRNRNQDLPSCGALPHPTALLVPQNLGTILKKMVSTDHPGDLSQYHIGHNRSKRIGDKKKFLNLTIIKPASSVITALMILMKKSPL